MNVDDAFGGRSSDHVAGDTQVFPGVIRRQRRYRQLSGPRVGDDTLARDDRQPVLSIKRIVGIR